MTTAPTQEVHIYIDNSNVYIEGQKSYSSNRNDNAAWRYDVNRLRDVLCNHSDLFVDWKSGASSQTTLYGSEPPPGDLWLALESQDVKVVKYVRHPFSGKEKKVDAKMVADITEQATIDQVLNVPSEFIIVTGDADIYPAVEKVIEKGFRAHVWSWRTSSSKEYQNQWDESGRQTLSVHFLDNYRDQFESQKVQQMCGWRKYCNKALGCKYLHPQDDLAYFAKHQGSKPAYRYRACKFGEKCNKKDTCLFFHNETERLCPTCDATGQGHGELGSPEWQRFHGAISSN
ncbi:hypothetical protein BCR34DRAFT_553045 [Clohesyomyces aquaticus]|uniref:NYN domain-containing protein n=1 Tax=Clohesyomyces aquaticus TaxID=1231657 RepID=A0A1Y2A8X5_9PLEO|nr:hypothetical protein BCR34DRAFT_553045 [Clohesyomyces aquaticus]